MKCHLRTNRGFTLVEVLIVMAMFGVIMGAVYSLYITNLRTSYTSDETAEVQQNMRIAMDVVTRDLRMAGMLVDYGNDIFPIQTVLADNTGLDGSDGITLNMASATGSYARIDADITPTNTSAIFALTPSTTFESPVTASSEIISYGDGDTLQIGDRVRIFRALQNTQPSVADSVFEVTAVQRQVGLKVIAEAVDVITEKLPLPIPPATPPAVTVKDVSGASMSGIEFKRGDIIAKVNAGDTTTPAPNTIQYAIVTNAAAPATTTTDPNCPVNQRCLARRLNNETSAGNPVWQIVAQNLTDFQLRYLLDDGGVVDTPTDRSLVKGVMVAISGETVSTRSLSNNLAKTRQLSSIVKLRNRR